MEQAKLNDTIWPTGNGAMASHIRAHNWRATPLGQIEGWSLILRTAVDLMMAARQPAYVAWGPELALIYNEACLGLLDHPAALGRPYREAWPEIWTEYQAIAAAVMAGEAQHLVDRPVPLAGPTSRFTLSWTPLRNGLGRVAGLYGAIMETPDPMLSERAPRENEERRQFAAAEAALRESEARFRGLVSASSDVLYLMSPDWTEMRQLSGGGFLADTVVPDRDWLDKYIHPGDQARVMARITRAIRNKTVFEFEHRVQRADGTLGWTLSRAVPMFDEHGGIVEWFGAASDVSGRRAAEERQRLLLAELQHRVRNIMAVIRSVAQRTAETSRNVADYAHHLEGRIGAMARTQALVMRTTGEGVDLRELILDELNAQAIGASRFSCEGPDVCLSSKAAEVLTLAVHELATNATKYGAAATRRGRIEVQWSIEQRDGEPWLRLTWTETGVKVKNAARVKEGFGTELVTRRVPYELRGKGTMELLHGGLQAAVEFPLAP